MYTFNINYKTPIPFNKLSLTQQRELTNTVRQQCESCIDKLRLTHNQHRPTITDVKRISNQFRFTIDCDDSLWPDLERLLRS